MTSQRVTLLDRGEAAERLRVSLSTVRRYGRAGLLDERRVGPKLVRVTEASVDALLRGGHDDDDAAGARREEASDDTADV